MAFSKKSLTILNGEARISDKRVAEALGYREIGSLHRVLVRNRVELASYGELYTTAEMPEKGTGRPIINYLLTEEQAVLLCMFSRTKKAALARKKIIEVFTAWRRNQIAPPPQSMPAREPIAVLHERRTAITGMVGTYSAATVPMELISSLPIWPSGRRPYWWYDEEVRELLTRTHRQMIQKEALALCIDKYGAKRSASKTGLNRYWIRLDRVFGNNHTRAVRNLERQWGDL